MVFYTYLQGFKVEVESATHEPEPPKYHELDRVKRHKSLYVLLRTQSPGHQIDGTNTQTSLKGHLQTKSQGNHMAELSHHRQSRQMKNDNTADKHIQSQNRFYT